MMDTTEQAVMLRMALAEAGYPDAEVVADEDGVTMTGAPMEVLHKACDLLDQAEGLWRH